MQQNSAYICMHFCSVSYVLARIGDRMKWAAGKKCLPNGKNFLPEKKMCNGKKVCCRKGKCVGAC